MSDQTWNDFYDSLSTMHLNECCIFLKAQWQQYESDLKCDTSTVVRNRDLAFVIINKAMCSYLAGNLQKAVPEIDYVLKLFGWEGFFQLQSYLSQCVQCITTGSWMMHLFQAETPSLWSFPFVQLIVIVVLKAECLRTSKQWLLAADLLRLLADFCHSIYLIPWSKLHTTMPPKDWVSDADLKNVAMDLDVRIAQILANECEASTAILYLQHRRKLHDGVGNMLLEFSFRITEEGGERSLPLLRQLNSKNTLAMNVGRALLNYYMGYNNAAAEFLAACNSINTDQARGNLIAALNQRNNGVIASIRHGRIQEALIRVWEAAETTLPVSIVKRAGNLPIITSSPNPCKTSIPHPILIHNLRKLNRFLPASDLKNELLRRIIQESKILDFESLDVV